MNLPCPQQGRINSVRGRVSTSAAPIFLWVSVQAHRVEIIRMSHNVIMARDSFQFRFLAATPATPAAIIAVRANIMTGFMVAGVWVRYGLTAGVMMGVGGVGGNARLVGSGLCGSRVTAQAGKAERFHEQQVYTGAEPSVTNPSRTGKGRRG